MLQCPYCSYSTRQVKAGVNNGVQRYRCGNCNRRYTPIGADGRDKTALKKQAKQLKDQGCSLREISRQMGVHHTTISQWLNDSIALTVTSSPDPPPSVSGPKRRSTIAEVAQQAGVAISTVSNYINGKGRMSAATRERIRLAIDDLHFTPSALARSIRERRTGVIGLLSYDLIDLDNPTMFVGPLLSGINEAANSLWKDLHVFTGWPSRIIETNGSDLTSDRSDGLLWIVENKGLMERVARTGLPIISVTNRDVPDNVGYVISDNEGAMRMVVSHLVGLGHRVIAYAGFNGGSDFQDRYTGFKQALMQYNLPVDTDLHNIRQSWPMNNAMAEWQITKWMERPERPTAIVCDLDGCAAFYADAAVQCGLRIPEDIAITGFDDLPLAEKAHGGITSIRQQFRKIGYMAADRLVALIDGAPVEECRAKIPTLLVVRNSTAKGL